MFYVPSHPCWSKDRLFLTDGGSPLLVAHVGSSAYKSDPVGRWAFAHPADFQHLLDGIAGSQGEFSVTSLSLLTNSTSMASGIIAEEVLDVITNSSNADVRIFLVRTVTGNSYLLGDKPVDKTALNITIYQSSHAMSSRTQH